MTDSIFKQMGSAVKNAIYNISLSSLQGVDLTTKIPQNNDVLFFDGSNWISKPISDNSQIIAPTITSPSEGDNITDYSTFTVTSSEFQVVGADLHESTSWQISTNNTFSTIFFESLNDTANKTSINLSAVSFVPGTKYYIRVKYHGVFSLIEEWSAPISFGQAVVITPSITSPIAGTHISNYSSFYAYTSAFQYTGNCVDTHVSTSWQISTSSTFATIFWESLNNTTNKTSISLSSVGFLGGSSYYIRAKHIGAIDTDTDWSASKQFYADIPAGEQVYTTPGTYTWVCPSHVSYVSAVCVGGGGSGWVYSAYAKGGGGGGLGYKNSYAVTPGNSYTVVVGAGGTQPTASSASSCGNSAGGDSYFVSTSVVKGGGGGAGVYTASNVIGGAGGTHAGSGGGDGGDGGNNYAYCGGGGGAGGYSGAGGSATYQTTSSYNSTLPGGDGTGGGGGAGASGYSGDTAGSGGGVGLYGIGTNGIGGNASTDDGGGGYGGSGGSNAASAGSATAGAYSTSSLNTPGLYGGGSGASDGLLEVDAGGKGAVRLMWGTGRSFPSNAA